MTEACQLSSTGGPSMTDARPMPGVPEPSSQSATRWATPPDMTPPRAQASIATAGPPSPYMTVRGSGVRRYRPSATTVRATTRAPWPTVRTRKVTSPGSEPAETQPGRDQAAYTTARTSRARAAPGRQLMTARSSRLSIRRSLRPRRQTTQSTTRVPSTSVASISRPRRSGTGPLTARSCRAAAPATEAATVRNPAAVCAARSRATSRRPYQKPGRPRAGRTTGAEVASVPPTEGPPERPLGGAAGPSSGPSSSGASSSGPAPVSGRCDSYALQVRLDRYQSSPTSAVGTTAASASRRPGCDHQPPCAVDRKPSQDRRFEQSGTPAHCQATRSRATSQAAAVSSTVRLSATSRTSTPYSRTARVRPLAVGRIQWARLTTMNGSSRSQSAREPLPEVRLDQQ